MRESAGGSSVMPRDPSGEARAAKSPPAGEDGGRARLTDDEALEYLVRFEHPGCFLRDFPSGGVLSPSAEAEIYDAPPDRIEAPRTRLTSQLEAHVHGVADHISAPDAGRSEAPLQILAVDDSITDDYLSWAYLLERAFEARAPGRVRVENCAVSGATSAGVLLPLVRALSRHPDVVIVMVGTNDALFLDGCGKPLVSDVETAANLAAIGAMVAALPAPPPLIWITPPPVDPDAMGRHPIVSSEPISHQRGTVEARIEIVGSQPGPVVDLREVLGQRGEAWLVDGVHPSVQGQIRIARATRSRGVCVARSVADSPPVYEPVQCRDASLFTRGIPPLNERRRPAHEDMKRRKIPCAKSAVAATSGAPRMKRIDKCMR